MPKDREIVLSISENVQIVYLRSSSYPYEYAVMLQVREEVSWRTVMVADNSHEGERRDTSVDDHHCHRYAGDKKRAPEQLPYNVVDTNDAMVKAIEWFADSWEELVSGT